jgi:general secretion pathway protein E
MRKLCAHCAGRKDPTDQELAWLRAAGVEGVTSVPAAAGCDHCHGTGYKGRFVVAEVHELDDAFRDLATEGAPVSALKAYALAKGVQPLVRRAARHVLASVTTLDEVKRVVGRPE